MLRCHTCNVEWADTMGVCPNCDRPLRLTPPPYKGPARVPKAPARQSESGQAIWTIVVLIILAIAWAKFPDETKRWLFEKKGWMVLPRLLTHH
jgi:hypothetical protein